MLEKSEITLHSYYIRMCLYTGLFLIIMNFLNGVLRVMIMSLNPLYAVLAILVDSLLSCVQIVVAFIFFIYAATFIWNLKDSKTNERAKKTLKKVCLFFLLSVKYFSFSRVHYLFAGWNFELFCS